MPNPYPAEFQTQYDEKVRLDGEITFTDPANQPGGGGGGSVNSVTAGDASITIGGTATDPTVAVAAGGVTTAKLGAAAVTNAKIAALAVDASQITSGAATSGWVPVADGLGGLAWAASPGVNSLTAADASIVVAGTGSAPTVRTGTLDTIATQHPPTAAVAMNAQKITGLANGTVASDAAAFGQIPTALPPNGSAGGDLSGTYPNPTVAAIQGVAVSGTAPSANQVLTATDATHAAWATPSSGAFSGCRVYNSTAQSIPNTTATRTTWDSETWDTDSYHSTVTNTGRLTVPSTGYYAVWSIMNFAASSAGDRYSYILINGTTIEAYVALQNADTTSGHGTVLSGYLQVQLTALDYVECFVSQGSGGSLNLTGGASGGSFFGIARLG